MSSGGSLPLSKIPLAPIATKRVSAHAPIKARNVVKPRGSVVSKDGNGLNVSTASSKSGSGAPEGAPGSVSLHPPHTHSPQHKPLADTGSSPKADSSKPIDARFLLHDNQEEFKASPLNVSNIIDRTSLCLDILVQGHVDSFVDFFYLTHRYNETKNNPGPVTKSNLTHKSLAGESNESIPLKDLTFIKENLTKSEEAHRKGDAARVFEGYEQLAYHFEKTEDFKTAIYFFEKCYDLAEHLNDPSKQTMANFNLGITYDRMGDVANSIVFHEKNLEILLQLQSLQGQSSSVEAAIKQGRDHLVEVYRRYAEGCEKKGDHKQAIDFYHKCLRTAKDANDMKNEGLATYRLGVACKNVNEIHQAIEHQKEYLQICQNLGDQLGEGAACAALAQSFQELGDVTVALEFLENYLEVATKNEQFLGQVEACTALGGIFTNQGNHDKAVSYFEKAFQIAQTLEDKRLVEPSRVNLGMALANVQLHDYLKLVTKDMDAVLQWKSRRKAFVDLGPL